MTVVVSFDGEDIRNASPFPMTVRGIDRGAVVAPEVVAWRRSGADGSKFIELSLPPRQIVVSILLHTETAVQARQAEEALAAILLRREPKPLTFTDQDGEYRAIFSDVSIRTPMSNIADGGITFTCFDPFRFTGEEVLPIPQSGTVDSATNWYVEPVWTLTVSTASTAAAITSDSDTVTFTGDLAPGDVLVFDTAARETRLNGELRVVEVDGTYPVLAPSSEVEIAAMGSVTVTYQSRWV